ncbi:hypothetical protein D9758_015528 [Tetrapyrgos nigripes]|uniref:Uncharacterized protein n=1 Tax=Tetrapyrgos nigripes TaxID=182062 RepID=A0A8H5FUA1_9AGAR|nr:hypothetical protein D9758_015528 [Tetrapyrgos nigripes]
MSARLTTVYGHCYQPFIAAPDYFSLQGTAHRVIDQHPDSYSPHGSVTISLLSSPSSSRPPSPLLCPAQNILLSIVLPITSANPM